MIKVPFSLWLTALLTLGVGIFFYLWLKDFLKEDITKSDKKGIDEVMRCPYCGAVVEKKGSPPHRCPVCNSWV